MDELVDTVRWLQVIAMVGLTFTCSVFLFLYLRVWDKKNPFSQYIATLNTTAILVSIAFITGRIFPGLVFVEFMKFTFIVALVIVMAYQLFLIKYSRRL